MGEVGAPSCAYTGADECVLRHAVRMLDRLGDRAGASQMYDEFTRRVRQTLDVEPSPRLRCWSRRWNAS